MVCIIELQFPHRPKNSGATLPMVDCAALKNQCEQLLLGKYYLSLSRENTAKKSGGKITVAYTIHVVL
jgi:hypothetical protein